MLERVPERDENTIGVERFLENVVGAELRRLDGGLDRSVAADHHDDRAWIALLDLAQGLEAVDAGHLDVKEDEVRLPAFILGDPVDGVRDGAYLIPLELEQLAECGPHALLVVDDENPPHEWARGEHCRARRKASDERMLSRKARRCPDARNAHGGSPATLDRDASPALIEVLSCTA